MTKVLMHPKPMARHTQHVQPAEAGIQISMPPLGWRPGLHIVFRIPRVSTGDGPANNTQRVISPPDQLDELEAAIKALRAATSREN